ncbi:hypothetical protein MASR2M79_13470 [Aminivibrio sp.]
MEGPYRHAGDRAEDSSERVFRLPPLPEEFNPFLDFLGGWGPSLSAFHVQRERMQGGREDPPARRPEGSIIHRRGAKGVSAARSWRPFDLRPSAEDDRVPFGPVGTEVKLLLLDWEALSSKEAR